MRIRTPGPKVTALRLSTFEKKFRRCFEFIYFDLVAPPEFFALALFPLSAELKEVLSLSSDAGPLKDGEERETRRRVTSSPMLCVSGNCGGKAPSETGVCVKCGIVAMIGDNAHGKDCDVRSCSREGSMNLDELFFSY